MKYSPQSYLKKSLGAIALTLILFLVSTTQAQVIQSTTTGIPSQFSQTVGSGALLAISATNITQTTATISGKMAPNTPAFTIYADVSQTGTFSDQFSPQSGSDGMFTYQLTGLAPAFTYHFVAIKTSDGKTRLSSIQSFVTPEVSAKLYFTKIDDTSATIEGVITEGAKNPEIIYGTKMESLGTPVAMSPSGGTYKAELSGLTAETNYYYQLQGDDYKNSGKKVYYSGIFSFITTPKAADSGTSTTGSTGSDSGFNTTAAGSYDSSSALVKCGIVSSSNPAGGPLNQNGSQACGFKELLALASDIIDFLLFVVAPIIATVLILYHGFMILTSGGNTEALGHAKSALFKVVVGLVIAMGAWLIVKGLLVALGVDTTVFPVFYK